jgi:dTDP-glucose 4,6-dehydratase
LGSISPTRDFNYIEDTVEAFICAINSNSGIGEVINIGSNYEISIADTVSLIAKIMGANVEIISDLDRVRPTNSEVERLWACNRKAYDLLGWSPNFSGREGFGVGLSKTIEWFDNKKNLSRYKHNIYNI